VTVHHERRVKREQPTRCNKSDIYYQTSISTCFAHHYAHLQEKKTVSCCMWFSALVVLVVVVWSCVVSCVHLHTVHTAHDTAPHNHTKPQPTQTVQNTTCGSTRSCSPDDGHNDVRNMLRWKFDNKYRICCILLVSVSSPYVKISI